MWLSPALKKCIPCLLFVFGWMIGLPVFAQGPAFIHYSVADGLPGDEVFAMVSDSLGNLYFGTNRGISRFDGRRFTTMKDRDGRNLGSTLRMMQAPDGRIWAFLFDGNVFYLDGAVFRRVEYKQRFAREYKDKLGIHVESIRKEGENGYTFGIRNRRIVSTQRALHNEYNALGIGIYADMSGAMPLVFSYREVWQEGLTWPVCVRKESAWDTIVWRPVTQPDKLFYIQRRTGTVLLSAADILLELDKNGNLSDSLSWPVSSLMEDREGRLWMVNGSNGKVWVVEPGHPLADVHPFPLAEEIWATLIVQDAEGGYWFLTAGEGVYYAPNLAVRFYSNESLNDRSDKTMFLCRDDSDRVFSVGSREIIPWENGLPAATPLVQYNLPEGTYPMDVQAWGNREFVLLGRKWLWLVEDQRVKKMPKGGFLSVDRPTPDYLVLGGYIGDLIRIKLSDLSIQKWAPPYHLRAEHVLVMDTNYFFIGSLNGLFRCRNGVWENLGERHSVLSGRITDIVRYGKHGIIVATAAGYLAYLKDEIFLTFDFSERSEGDPPLRLHIYHNELWITGNHGIYAIDLSTPVPGFRWYRSPHGLLGSNYGSLVADEHYVFAADETGLYVFDKKSQPLTDTSPAPVFMEAIVNNDEQNILGVAELLLGHRENTVRLQFRDQNFRVKDFAMYRYRIPELSSSYFYTQETSIMLSGLKPGSYHIQLEARNQDGFWSATPSLFLIKIRPHWSATWWFRTLAIVSGGVLLFVGITAYFRRVRQRNSEKLMLLESQQIALARLMNPHFVFNVMNSLQGLILSEEKRKSAGLLSDFSKVMRLSIDSTRFKYVALEKEIELLLKYIAIESLQHHDKFSFDLDDQSRIPGQTVLVPPMLIQPFVENALKHGVLPLKERKGRIMVSIYWRGKDLLCKISDNGVGFFAATKKSPARSTHYSSGMEITTTRMKLLHKENKSIYYFHIGEPEAENATGSYVEFSIPYKLQESP